MSMKQLQTELIQLLLLGKDNQRSIIKRLDELIIQYGMLKIQSWRNYSNRKKNTLLHELVEMELLDVVRYFLKKNKFNVNIRRESDGITPFQLAIQNQNIEMCNLLKQFGADQIETEDAKNKENMMNIVWLDLEMTSLEDPEILECAVIITDKDLNELERCNWVIHFEQSKLEKLGDWHQDTFKSRKEGGNGLFHDCIKSKLTKEEVEHDLLNLLKRHCPEKMCPLAGSSIHIDKEVLKRWMPEVHNYLHYRIIDVSSFQAIMRRWTPWIESKIKKQLATNGQQIVKHRAMDDIEWSIAFMTMFRPHLEKQHNANHRNNEPLSNHKKRSASVALVARSMERPRHNRDDNRASQLYTDEKQLVDRLQIEQKFDIKILHLSKGNQLIYNRNPHLREVFMNNQVLEVNEEDFTYRNRFLTLPRNQSYKNGFDSRKLSTIEHWGQRKLLLTEIEFLTNYGVDRDYLVIYAGAAPGSHINCLSSLFPRLVFVLIDAKDFSATETEKIHFKRENFTTDLARHYSESKYDILFICNVHTYTTNDNMQKNVLDDMENQLIWHKLIKPRASLLNFRVPRVSGKVKYFEGDLIIEPWTLRRATECRLVVDKDPKIVDYNVIGFEEAMIYFNNVTRIMYYKHNMDDIDTEGLDHCYDCRAEIFILQQYLNKIIKINNESELKKQTSKLSSDISRLIHEKNRPKIISGIRTLGVIPKK